ncbi:hypothetical protein [Paraburkholderia sp. GAS334]|uniref:hypothetical protein n=1 Tax=Paraburkholderia sp. GAS334 TaxID=3035131 RepID=UPI003D2415DD
MWTARAYTGEYLRSPDGLGLLSARFGSREWPENTALPFDAAGKCLLCLLSDLKVASRYYLPIDPAAKPTRFVDFGGVPVDAEEYLDPNDVPYLRLQKRISEIKPSDSHRDSASLAKPT